MKSCVPGAAQDEAPLRRVVVALLNRDRQGVLLWGRLVAEADCLAANSRTCIRTSST